MVIIDNSSIKVSNALSLSETNVAIYLNSFENGAGTDKLIFENTNSIFYLTVLFALLLIDHYIPITLSA